MDTTFYRVPRKAVVQDWAAAVPSYFRFATKTPRSITHEMGLVGVNQFMIEFIDVMRHLREKLGVILIQLPPSFTIDKLQFFTAFLRDLPNDIHFAVEFRHNSWYTQRTRELLQTYRIGWVASEFSNLPLHSMPTADFNYLRWLGKHAAFRRYDHEQLDVSLRLSWWENEIHTYVNQDQTVYGFFNNEYSGFAPATCNRFKVLLGLPTVSFQQPVQKRLF